MTILCLGCSWTSKYQKDIYPWPEVIQSKTKEEVINLGVSGSGNKYAFDQFIITLRGGIIPKSVYWLMTEFDRIDIISKDKNIFLHNFYTIKTITQGKNKNKFLERWEKNYKKKNDDENFISNKERVIREAEISEIIAEIYDPLDFIDYNLNLIYLTQEICKKFNIELKIGMALLPIQHNLYDNISEKDMGWGILKSKHAKKLDLKNIMGYPFYKSFGGISGNAIKNWNINYGISVDDNHPNQNGSNLLASFFLGEKNILDYK